MAKSPRAEEHVNNAGIGRDEPLAQTATEDVEQLLDVNLRGAILLTRAVLPGMLQRRHGAIISVASVAGHVAVNPLYSATKFGLRGFSLALHRQLAGSGVSVSLVSPGFIRSGMTHGMWLPMPGPELVARRIADLVTRPRREAIVPGYYMLPIWIDRLLPRLVDRGIWLRQHL